MPLGGHVQVGRARTAVRAAVEGAVLPRAVWRLQVDAGARLGLGGHEARGAVAAVLVQRQLQGAGPARGAHGGASREERVPEGGDIGARQLWLGEDPDARVREEVPLVRAEVAVDGHLLGQVEPGPLRPPGEEEDGVARTGLGAQPVRHRAVVPFGGEAAGEPELEDEAGERDERRAPSSSRGSARGRA
ncbi:hypothetical protein ACN28S_43235 [Cystobacter fuscus]